MAVFLAPIGNGFQFLDTNGKPLNAGLLNTYAAGSTTPTATYTTSIGSVQNANPIVLNADGRPPSEIWLTGGTAYKFVLTDSLSNLLGTYDNLYGIGDPNAANASTGYFPLTSVSGTNTITAAASAGASLATGNLYVMVPAGANTGATTLNITPSGGAALGAKNIFWKGVALAGRELQTSIPVVLQYDGTQFNIIDGSANTLTVYRSYLAGLALSTAGASATMSIAAGQAADSTNVAMMILAASISKTTSAWAVGSAAGGLDNGVIANSTWYHFFEIMRLDTGVVDVLFSTNASAPTMPANYTLKRRIGSGLTNGSAQWTSFTQDGNFFEWTTPFVDVSANAPGTAAVTRTLAVPLGVNVLANVQAILANNSAVTGAYLYLSDLATTDTAASATFTDTADALNAAGGANQVAVNKSVRTNTSQQIRSRAGGLGDGNVTLTINTLGWIDSRGRDS